MSTTNHLAIQLRQLWERAKELGRTFDVLEELSRVRAAAPLDSTEISMLERWAGDRTAKG